MLTLSHVVCYRVNGGILADEAGLGKTLSMLTLIVQAILSILMQQAPNGPDTRTSSSVRVAQKVAGGHALRSRSLPGLVSSSATLIICPALQVPQWKKQIEEHLAYGFLRVSNEMIWHAPHFGFHFCHFCHCPIWS